MGSIPGAAKTGIACGRTSIKTVSRIRHDMVRADEMLARKLSIADGAIDVSRQFKRADSQRQVLFFRRHS
jgi:hypothetical protein